MAMKSEDEVVSETIIYAVGWLVGCGCIVLVVWLTLSYATSQVETEQRVKAACIQKSQKPELCKVP